MRQLPEGLQAHLERGVTTICWCWRLATRGGAVLGFTDHDETIRFGGSDYEAQAGFTGSEIKSSLGLAIDNLDVASALSSGRLEDSGLAAGDYDDAEVEIWLVNWQAPEQRLLVRKGNLGEVLARRCRLLGRGEGARAPARSAERAALPVWLRCVS